MSQDLRVLLQIGRAVPDHRKHRKIPEIINKGRETLGGRYTKHPEPPRTTPSPPAKKETNHLPPVLTALLNNNKIKAATGPTHKETALLKPAANLLHSVLKPRKQVIFV
jgi:hypothetical protein